MSDEITIVSVVSGTGKRLPVNGNSLGQIGSASMKQERGDEAEIQERAEKLIKSQRDRVAKQLQQAQVENEMQVSMVNSNVPISNLNNVDNSQELPNGTITSPNAHHPEAIPNKANEELQRGHFGWTTVGKMLFPYIYFKNEKYCSARMLEMKLLSKYLNSLHPDIYTNCRFMRSYYITEEQSRLLTEINQKHCDSAFGTDVFTEKEVVVRLTDAKHFYMFVEFCYRKLIADADGESHLDNCGFIRINKESCVSYILRNNEQVVPLFYFEVETNNLKHKTTYLWGWELSYLHFCGVVQGIRKDLVSSSNIIPALSLTDIKSFFPRGTEFENFWPSKESLSKLLIENHSNANNFENWILEPQHFQSEAIKMLPQKTIPLIHESKKTTT